MFRDYLLNSVRIPNCFGFREYGTASSPDYGDETFPHLHTPVMDKALEQINSISLNTYANWNLYNG